MINIFNLISTRIHSGFRCIHISGNLPPPVSPEYTREEFPPRLSSHSMRLNYIKDRLLSKNPDSLATSYLKYKSLLDTFSFKVLNSWDNLLVGSIDDTDFISIINSFIKNIPDNNIVCILPCVLTDNRIITLSQQLFVTNYTDPESLREVLLYLFESKMLPYQFTDESQVFFKHRGIVPSSPIDKNHLRNIQLQLKNVSTSLNSVNYKIPGFINKVPLTTKLNEFGRLINPEYLSKVSNLSGSLFQVDSHYIFVSKNGNILNGEVYDKNNKYVHSFEDTINPYFTNRKFSNNYSITFDNTNGKLFFITFNLTTDFLTIGRGIGFNFLPRMGRIRQCTPAPFFVIDLETYVIPETNKLTPYAVGILNESKEYLYYLTDYNSCETMIQTAFQELFKDMGEAGIKNAHMYAHNLSGFDGVYLLNYLNKTGFKVEPTFKETKLIKLKISLGTGDSKLTIKILDSFLLLPDSLENLSKGFKVSTQKKHFPHKFVSYDTLNYIGPMPGGVYYYNPPELLKNNQNKLIHSIPNWNLKEELLNYLKGDLQALHQVLKSFQQENIKLYNIDITNFTTISSLVFFIWRAYFVKNTRIPILSGKIYDFIKQSHFGGINMVITPFGFNLHDLDINSAYPSAMCNPMPVGSPVYVKTTRLEDIGFGFARVKIKTPSNLHIPVLPVKTEKGVIYPLGSWEGIYFIPELKMAQEFGYEITVIEGYKFEKEYKLFNKYVKLLYPRKKKEQGARRFLYKLQLNSLSGMLGLKENHQITKKIKISNLEEILKKHTVYHTIPIDENTVWVSYEKTTNSKLAKLWGVLPEDLVKYKLNEDLKIPHQSVGIASAITSYARIHLIYQIKNLLNKNDCGITPTRTRHITIPHHKKEIQIYYIDTDQMIANKLTDFIHIGDNLGQFNLRNSGVTGIFIKKKLYALIPPGGRSPIIKASSLGDKINPGQIYELYLGKNVKVKVEKLFKNMPEGNIINKQTFLNITPSEIGRQKVYSEGKWVSTTPYFIKDKIIQVTALILRNPGDLTKYTQKSSNLSVYIKKASEISVYIKKESEEC